MRRTKLFVFQVQLIRKALKKKNPDLREVVVERIHGVQGRPYYDAYT